MVFLWLTFDPVSFAEAEVALVLGRVRTGGHKHTARDGAVEPPALLLLLLMLLLMLLLPATTEREREEKREGERDGRM